MAPGMAEMLMIGIVVILLFGPNKIPELARSAGKFMGEFTRAQREVEMEYTNSKEQAKKEPRSESNKIRKMAEDLGIDVQGKSDDDLLDEIQATIKKEGAVATD
ncbi:MAG: twin-arginine translocase TatA/TatE family subunit [Halobacteriota archaeon]|nr:twin-arginine translocase TatA/TatE family subunit [Halobacteriota archaeon]